MRGMQEGLFSCCIYAMQFINEGGAKGISLFPRTPTFTFT